MEGTIAHEFAASAVVVDGSAGLEAADVHRVPTAAAAGMVPLDQDAPSAEVLHQHDDAIRELLLQTWTSAGMVKLRATKSAAGGRDTFNLLVEEPDTTAGSNWWTFLTLAWASLGVVFGDIGTSPIYTINNVLTSISTTPAPADVIGCVSLIIWSLILIVVLKYVLLVLCTDYQGKGGIFALISLLFPISERAWVREMLVFLACMAFGAMLADGMLTPAISVLSAMEGVLIPAPQLGVAFTVPMSVAVLLALFVYQRVGSAKIGYTFSPVMILWYIILAGYGIYWITMAPDVLQAFNPWLGINFLVRNQVAGWLALSFVLLSLTGCEALYADRGHFGANPIRLSWFAIVFPALVLNYLGQGALLLVNPTMVNSPFFNMVAGSLYWPIFVVTLLSTIIASQSLISAVFSLVQQAVKLDICPRVRIVHTSGEHEGQVYVPAANVVLCVAVLVVVVGFQRSANLADSFGLAVAVIMFQTSFLFCFVMHRVWHVWVVLIVAIMTPIMLLELGFLTAAFARVPHGAWFTLVVTTLVTIFFYVWHRGRIAMFGVMSRRSMSIEEWVGYDHFVRVPSLSFFFTPLPVGIPVLLRAYAANINSLPSHIVLTTIRVVRLPCVSPGEMYVAELMAPGIWRLLITTGFNQPVNFSSVRNELQLRGLNTQQTRTTYVFEDPRVKPDAKLPWYHRLMIALFGVMHAIQVPLSKEHKVPALNTMSLGHTVKC